MDNAQPDTRDTPPIPAAPLNRLEVLHGLRVAIWEGCSSTVWASLTTNILLTGFALWLGASPFVIGLLTAIPTFAGLIQVASSFFSDRLTARKPFVAWFSVIGRTLWLPILSLPFFFSKPVALTLFLLLYTLSYVALNVPIPAYMAWMSDLVPANHRGRYFGQRNMIMGLIGMGVGLPAAWFLDFMLKKRGEGEIAFAVLFGIATLSGILSFFFLKRQAEPPVQKSSVERPKGLAGALEYYRTPFADKNFVRLMKFNVIFGMGQFFAAPFFNVYAIQKLHISYTTLQIFSTVTAVMSLLAMPLWGSLTDKFGNKPLLAIGAIGVIPLPLYWAMTTPLRPGISLFLIQLINVQGGVFWAAVGLTQFNLLIRSAPSEKTPIYAATMAAVTGLTGGLAPLLGGFVMKALDGIVLHPAHLLLDNYRVTFLIAAGLRMIGLLQLRKIHDGESASTRTVLYELRNASPRTWRNLRKLQRGGGELERLRATEALAESKTRLATGELEWALRDPSLAVRSEAARALGQIGERGSVEALIAAMNDPASFILQEAAYSLAQIGDARAVAPFLNLICDTDRPITERCFLIKSLGRLGSPSAIEPLKSLLHDLLAPPIHESRLITALLETLTILAPHEITSDCLTLLVRTENDLLLQACVRGLGASGNLETIAHLMPFLEHAPSEALTVALAEALAELGARAAAPKLYALLPEQSSPLARTQIAHAIGELMGAGETIYSLLSREPFSRDAELSTLVREMQRGKSDRVVQSLADALSAFLEGDYGGVQSTLLQAEPAPILLKTPLSEPTLETCLLDFIALSQTYKD